MEVSRKRQAALNPQFPAPPPRRSRSGSTTPEIRTGEVEQVSSLSNTSSSSTSSSTTTTPRENSPKRIRVQPPTTTLTSRETSLYLAGETLATAATQWLVEETFRNTQGRAVKALTFGAQLLHGHGRGSGGGRRGAGMLDEVRRFLIAAQPEGIVYTQWARPGASFRKAKQNYAAWDPPIEQNEWNREVKVLRIIRSAIREAVLECHVHLYAPIVTVASAVGDKAVLIAKQIVLEQNSNDIVFESVQKSDDSNDVQVLQHTANREQ